jgi:hypothetical protein
MNKAKEKLAKFGKRSCVKREFGYNFSQEIENNSLDFVYLDARHDYKSVKNDIQDWFCKVKKGGIFAGHDYANNGNSNNIIEVKKAVDEFIRITGYELHLTLEDGAPSWWIIK